ncbi:endonuclease/exonuclease/phosphatase family protein [Kutzneria sp. CA-103260]|uniref:endonuclease/exonuclease/phosphatase family protein n=1 Tax=Kutzneria sp. CA-103260 TaxID=2802641 RepID=UPI001BACD86E|nr:endonuclease/exonuclease/phosphatase family protein [Kutzneria sp. CA-103260]QUQ70334.1 endonuclease/exonuclease/phosphatase family protein [Kutzneria sp. CA-103260]
MNRGRLAALISCAVLLTGVLVLAVTRIFGFDDGTYLAVPIALLPYAALLTAGLLVTLLALRGRWLTVAAAALLVLQLAWIVPRFVPDRPLIPADAVHIRVGTVNTHRGQVDPLALVSMAKDEHLDVLAAEELDAPAIKALDAAGMAQYMPYRELHPENDTSIFSRVPIVSGGPTSLPTTWPQTQVTVTVSGHQIPVVGVHTYYPVGGPGLWARDMSALRAVAGRDVIVLGDFNATVDHSPLRSLLAAGLVDTHAELGRGWAPTWPAQFPLVQIDHVLHGPGLAAVSASEHLLPGTDHRAVVAELALPG